ncbi:MAG: response regulator transcription factor [Betaproteobacteria bacterium]|nr:response regulator transcription factor [Betaproteobacteria bacterium]MBI2962100.1 response regulator transcription factor [Betaproteobacteria bacterium]
MSDSTGTILLIDDDRVLVELMSDQLRAVGHHPLAAFNGTEGLHIAAQENPDLVLLDVMMPGMSGWEVCERLRERSSVPIIMLTARDEEIDKLRAFRLGVDDYVTVPCSFAEVLARVEAVLRRTRRRTAPAAGFRSGGLSMDFALRRVMAGKRAVELTVTEYRLLETLARRSPCPVCLDTIVGEVWALGADTGFEQVKHYVWTLRRKIEPDPDNPRHLVTVRGFGYRLQ